jgi:hypothetical protein
VQLPVVVDVRPLPECPELLELLPGELLDWAVGSRDRQVSHGGLETLQQQEIAPAAHRCSQLGLRLLALPLERRQQLSGLGSRAELSGFHREMLEQNVEVADRPEELPEAVELGASIVDPGAVEHRPRGSQDRAKPPDRDPHVMDGVGVVGLPDRRIVRPELCELGGDELG